MRLALVVVLFVIVRAAAAGAECRASAGGAFSFDVRLSPLAGRACLMDVTVFAGPDCDPLEEHWADTRPCNETDRMDVTDHGSLIAIRAPATAHRDWSIVTVLRWRDERVVATHFALEDLPGTDELRGVVRPVFDGAAIRFSADVLLPFDLVESLADGRG